MKKILGMMIIFVILLFHAGVAFAAEEDKDSQNNQYLNEQYQAAGIDNIHSAAENAIDPQTREIIPDLDIDKLTKSLTTGDVKPDIGNIFNKIMQFFMKEVYLNLKIMLQLIVLTIICGLLTNLQSSFGREGVSEVAFFACFIFLIGVMVKSFTYAVGIGRDVIDNMVLFMQSMVPGLMTLLISTGNVASASLFQPMVLFSVQMIGAIVKNFLIPLLFIATSLAMVNNISDKFHVGKLVDFLKQTGKWVLCILLTGFIGVITVQGLASSVVEGVGSKAAKYAVGNFIPVVGGILSDAVDTVIGCSLILKNAVGIVGLIVIILICFIPVIKLAALIAIYRLTAAVVEPVSDKRIVQCISDLASSLTHIFAMVISIAIMLLLSVTIVVGAGNISAMFR